MFADDITICGERRDQVERHVERWGSALESKEMKISHSKKECVCK